MFNQNQANYIFNYNQANKETSDIKKQKSKQTKARDGRVKGQGPNIK